MRMALDALGIRLSEQEVKKIVKTDTYRGTWLKDMPRAPKMFKLKYVMKKDSSLQEIKRLLKEGYVVIVDYYVPKGKFDHYSVVSKIDSKRVHLMDPSSGPKTSYSIRYFERHWFSHPKIEPAQRWLLAMRK